MSKPRKAIVEKRRTVHMYADLWHASRCVLEAGIREERGCSWQFLCSIVLTAFTFEAYLNHVGPTMLRCWDELERLPPWSKFELLCEQLHVEFPKGTATRPLQTLVEILAFRNAMAHGRSEAVSPAPMVRDINDKLDGYLGERPLTQWERLIQSDSFAKRAREDLEITLKRLHTARPEPKESLFTFGVGLHSARFAAEP
jgi:hypothetical protein